MDVPARTQERLRALAAMWRFELDQLMTALPEADRVAAEPALAVPAAILVACALIPEELP